MRDKNKKTDKKSKDHKDNKPTAGNVKETGFENTTWEATTDHSADSTEAERESTAKTTTHKPQQKN